MSRAVVSEPLAAAEPLSLEGWVALPEDEAGEWVDGLLVEEEVPSFVHEYLVAVLVRLLGNWIQPRGGMVAGSGAKFVVAPDRGRKPDLTVYFPDRPLPPPRGAIRVPPDIAVEIVSETPRDGQRDRVEKVAEYAAFGIPFYWIVDPQMRSLEILELAADGRYSHALGATTGVLQDIPGCAGLSLDLDAVWAEVDRIERQALSGDDAKSR